ncbi:MAG: LysR family transcriptional regulator [Erysipelotrichaceae bacterium]|nr:LysR family transcriptional regulator [Erysipelotrichaceae bacterium]
MELRQLRYFLAVKDTKKISSAADLLHVTQPTLSISIQHLEEELGVSLFVRNNKGLQLTEAGEVFSIHAEKILKRVNTAISEMNKYRYSTPLEIGIPSVSCEMVYKLIYQDFQKRYPQIPFTVSNVLSSEAIEKVLDDEMEVGFCIVRKGLPEELSFLEIAPGEVQLLVTKGQFPEETDHISLEDLSSLNWIFNRRSNNKQSTIEKIVRDYLKENDVELQRAIYIRDQYTIVSNVSLGLGVYPYSNTNCQNPFQIHSDLRSLRIGTGVFYRMGMIYKKDNRFSASARVLFDWAKEISHQVIQGSM